MVDHKELTAPSRVAELLRRHGLRADKAFGQNFLVDAAALRAIVDAAALTSGDSVLEVGAGLGVLTRALALRGANVLALELDERLLPVLEETLADLTAIAGAGKVTVRAVDATTFDFEQMPSGSSLVANLPYNVATVVIARALESNRFRQLVVLVQREVAERLSAKASTAAYGALSLFIAHFGTARTVRLVPPGAFFPPPKVTSAVVRIVTSGAAPDPELFELIHAGFAHRRKTLVKNLVYAGYSREAGVAALQALELDERVRAEALDLAQFGLLRDLLAGGPTSSS